MTVLSNRAKKAIDVLSDGGYFVHRLERNEYTGSDKFAYRLIKNGSVIKGIGMSTFYEIKDKLVIESYTSVSTYYVLKD